MKNLLILCFSFLSINLIGQILDQGQFDEFSKDAAVVYSTDLFYKSVLQRDFDTNEGLVLVEKSKLFNNYEKKILKDLFKNMEVEINTDAEASSVLEEYRNLQARFEDMLICPPVLLYRMIKISKHLKENDLYDKSLALLQSKTVNAKDIDTSIYRTFYYDLKFEENIAEEKYNEALPQLRKSLNECDTVTQKVWQAFGNFRYSKEIYYYDADSSIHYANKCIGLSKKLGLHNFVSSSLLMLAIIDKDRGKIVSSLEKVYNAITYAENNNGKLYLFDMYNVAIESHLLLSQVEEAEEIMSKLERMPPQNTTYTSQSAASDRLTKGYLKGKILNAKGEKLKAIRAYQDALKISKEARKGTKANVWFNMAYLFDELGMNDSTFYATTKVNENNVNKDPYFVQGIEGLLVDYYIENNELKKAENAALANLEYGIRDSVKYSENSSYLDLSKIYELQNDFQKAYEYSQKYNSSITMYDGKEVGQKVAEARLTSEFDIEKKIVALENEREKALLKAEQTRASMFGGIALIGLLATGLFLYISRRNNKLILRQKQELEKLNNVKDQLFQIIGHDLRKPVIAFRNTSQNLNYLIERGDTARLKRLGEEIDHEGKSLYNLTDNLLQWGLSQKDIISINPEKVNVREIASENINFFAPIARKKDIELTNNIDASINVLADWNSLDTMLRNLIDNAIKYSQVGGEIIIDVKEEDKFVRISVSDSGIGMTKDIIQRIMSEDLVKSTEGTQNEKGSGIGMKIVRSMAQKNNGLLEVTSSLGKGSVFTISLPQVI